jgi:tyrosine phenol-lyase
MFSPEISNSKTIIEPFRIKMVESLPLPTYKERGLALQEAFYNLFQLPARMVTFDLLTDSGTSAMSAAQWSAMMVGDESYAGSDSYFRFRDSVSDLTGMSEVIPTHQGRSAEALIAQAMIKPGMIVPGNTHFDTTRANIESAEAAAMDLPCRESANSEQFFAFKGNIDLEGLKQLLETSASKIPFVVMTVTNNSVGGQPVSMGNLKAVRDLLKPHSIPLFIDAARFAENSYFIQQREEGYQNRTIKSIAQEMFSLADAVLMSAKKDAFGNIGGFLSVRDTGLAEAVRALMVVTEGFPTYGGLAGRDLEALAQGLKEVVDPSYLAYRVRSVEYFGNGLAQVGYKTVQPFGGHAVYIDAGKTLPHIPALQYPGQSLSVAMYESCGIRGVEVGSVMLGHVNPETGVETPAPKELVRLALPRRVYTQSHVDHMIEQMGLLAPELHKLSGFKIAHQNRFLRHFTARFAPLNANGQKW